MSGRWWTLGLENWANQIAARYGHPVYLVGSAIEQGANARDVDIVVILPTDEFMGRFGGKWMAMYDLTTPWNDEEKRLATEIGKMSATAARLTGLNIDMKVQSVKEIYMYRMNKKKEAAGDPNPHDRFLDRPRVRLDTLDLPELELPVE